MHLWHGLKILPNRIVLELTNRCNLRCVMCSQNSREFKFADLKVSILRKIEPILPKVQEVALFGWGEPLIAKNFVKIFKQVSQFDIKTYIVTNGLKLSEELAAMLVEKKLTYLGFSVDGANKHTYSRIRKFSNYDTVMRNLKYFVKLKGGRGQGTYTRLAMVLMRSNLDELPNLIKLAGEMGLDEVRATYLTAYGKEIAEESLFFTPEKIKPVFDKALKVGEKSGVKVSLPEVIGLEGTGEVKPKGPAGCTRPFNDTFIKANGQVTPCSVSATVVGDLNKQSFEDVWNGRAYGEFRKKIKSSNPPAECANCPQCNFLDVNNIKAHVTVDFKLPVI